MQKSNDNFSANKNDFNLTIFDLDHTLFSINSSMAYYFFLRKKKIFSFASLFSCAFYFFQYAFFNLSLEKFHQKIFSSVIKGKTFSIFSYVHEFLPKLIEHLYPPAFQALKDAKENHETILLLSNSPKEIVQAVAEYLEIPFFKASEYAVDANHLFTHIRQLMGGSEKAEFLKNFLHEHNNFKNITVYSDSFSDLPLFQLANRKMAVNPDRKLKRVAKQNHWEIL